MVKAEGELAAEVASWLDEAGEADGTEDADHGPDQRGDETSGWMADKQQRLARIHAACAAFEAEAKALAAAKEAGRPEPDTKADGTPSKRRGPKPTRPPGTPEPTTQRNFTDFESRIMLGRDGFIQAYNGQAAVDGRHQIIVAHRLTLNASDQDGLLPLLDATATNTGRLPDEMSADNDFCSETNLAGLVERGVRGYVATRRAKHPAAGKSNAGPLTVAMRRRLRQGRSSQPIPVAQAYRRARVRSDQGSPRISAAPSTRRREGHRLMGTNLHRPQPRQAHRVSKAVTRPPIPNSFGKTCQPLPGRVPSCH